MSIVQHTYNCSRAIVYPSGYSLHTIVQRSLSIVPTYIELLKGHCPFYAYLQLLRILCPLYNLHTIVPQWAGPLSKIQLTYNCPLYNLHTIVQGPLSFVQLTYNCSRAIVLCIAYLQLLRGQCPLYILNTIVQRPLYYIKKDT